MPRNGKFLILFNKFFCGQVKVHWLGPIVKWYTLVYESTPWNPYIRGGTYVPPSPHSLSLETTPLEFVDRVGVEGLAMTKRIWKFATKIFSRILWIMNSKFELVKKNQTCLCYLRAKLFLPDVKKKKIVSIIQNIAWSQLKRSTQTAL